MINIFIDYLTMCVRMCSCVCVRACAHTRFIQKDRKEQRTNLKEPYIKINIMWQKGFYSKNKHRMQHFISFTFCAACNIKLRTVCERVTNVVIHVTNGTNALRAQLSTENDRIDHQCQQPPLKPALTFHKFE